MTTDLSEVLRLHSLWLKSDPDGRRADLRGADLRGADLSDAVLHDADLRRADLRGAVLRGADLSGAVLSGAVLRGADLRYADLSDAVLRGAQGFPIVADAAERLQAVAATVLAQPEHLNMQSWHSACGTTHCLAGWAIHQAGPIGETLESLHGSYMAGMLLLGTEAAQHFYDTNEAALGWLKSVINQSQEVCNDN